MTNPLLEQSNLPPFSKIKPEHVKPAIDTLLRIARYRRATTLVCEIFAPIFRTEHFQLIHPHVGRLETNANGRCGDRWWN